MPWHIEFEVTDKYLSDAQLAVHKLRGIKNIGVRPIFEGSPSDKEETTKVSTDQIETFINNAKGKVKAATIADALGDSRKLVSAKLAYLATARRIKRVGQGLYTGVKKHG